MIPPRVLMIGTAAIALAVSGAVVAGGWQDAPPQNATPAAAPVVEPGPDPEAAPTGDPAPAVPIAITPPSAPVATEAVVVEAERDRTEDTPEDEKAGEDEGESESDKAERLATDAPAPRQRRRVAIIEAIDKITAESMRFEVEVGGRPVRFNQSLIFTARACEVSAEAELVQDSIAYLEITLQAKGTQAAAPRQIFRGWMYASTPALSGLQHPIYDAWVVGCKA